MCRLRVGSADTRGALEAKYWLFLHSVLNTPWPEWAGGVPTPVAITAGPIGVGQALLELGENIGDVAKERWRMDAQRHIDVLPVRKWDGVGPHTRYLCLTKLRAAM